MNDPRLDIALLENVKTVTSVRRTLRIPLSPMCKLQPPRLFTDLSIALWFIEMWLWQLHHHLRTLWRKKNRPRAIFIHGWVYNILNGDNHDLGVSFEPPGKAIPTPPFTAVDTLSADVD